MAAPLEQLLNQLLVPDNNAIQQATLQLKQVSQDPAFLPQLCQVVANAQDPQVRQYGAVLLRRRLHKKKQWTNLPDDFRKHLRENILHVFMQETEKTVRNAVGQIVATVAKHELANTWPELFVFLDQFTKSQDAREREVGLFVLSQVAMVADLQLKPHLLNLCPLFDQCLQDSQNPMVQYYAIVTMTHLVQQIGSDEQGKYQVLVPKVLTAIRQLVVFDETKAVEALEVLDELVESDVAIVVPHVKAIVEFGVEVASKEDLSDELRVKGMAFIGWLTRLKHKSILKHKLNEPILEAMFAIMCTPHDEDEDSQGSEQEAAAETSSPHAFAGQVIDTLAQYLPPKNVLPKMMNLIEPALGSENPHYKKAAYLALGVIVEGCSETIRSKHMDILLQCLAPGIQHPDPVVRNASLFALGQFSEFLQPDISKYASDLIPLLLNYLREGQLASASDSAMAKTFYALEMFCENMERDILPYLPSLMEQLTAGIQNGKSIRIRELSISCIAAVANAAKEQLLPHFQSVFEPLKPYLNVNCEKELLPLQTEAFDTLSVIARVIGAQNFMPLTHDCLTLGTQVIKTTEDPDLRRCVYGLMASVSVILKQDMAPFLPPIVDRMLESIRSIEGVTFHTDQEESSFKVFDEEDLGDTDTEDDEDSEIQGASVENAYLEEKEDAISSLCEIAQHSAQAFMPYVEDTYQEVEKMLDFPADIVRKAAATASVRLCICLSRAAENGVAEANTALSSMISNILPRLLTSIREDVERDVVTETTEALKMLLDEVKGPVLSNPDHLPMISECMKCVLAQKTACQDADEDPELDSGESEYDNVLVEAAGEIFPSLIKATNGDNSVALVKSILPDLLRRLKKDSSEQERSFAIGAIAEIIDALGDGAEVFVDQFYPIAMKCLGDQDEEVRSNAVYATGCLAKNGGQKILVKYDEIMKVLSGILARESNKRCIDNIMAAVCRMVLKNGRNMPLDQIVPVILKHLPLKEDFAENTTVFECVNMLYDAGQKDIFGNLSQILKLIGGILVSDQCPDECQVYVSYLVKQIRQNQSDVFNSTMATLGDDERIKMQNLLNV